MSENDNVHELRNEYTRKARDKNGGGTHNGGSGGGGSELEKRVEKLETAMSDIQIRLIRVESKLDSTATKTDLSELAVSFHKSMNEQTWKFLAGATSMAALFSAISFGLARALS